ncbi:hypothetical protein BDW22DRAFT_247569 [Trametopsis cervina]|nr:hypothetical protein BDW22DRAFT_247569 [Trametopsis cervina]
MSFTTIPALAAASPAGPEFVDATPERRVPQTKALVGLGLGLGQVLHTSFRPSESAAPICIDFEDQDGVMVDLVVDDGTFLELTSSSPTLVCTRRVPPCRQSLPGTSALSVESSPTTSVLCPDAPMLSYQSVFATTESNVSGLNILYPIVEEEEQLPPPAPARAPSYTSSMHVAPSLHGLGFNLEDWAGWTDLDSVVSNVAHNILIQSYVADMVESADSATLVYAPRIGYGSSMFGDERNVSMFEEL